MTPTAFQTTYSLDEDGNQVAEQAYIGETLDLLTVINDLKAQIATLQEALTEMDSLKLRLSALEGA